jgi:hypothetical protein
MSRYTLESLIRELPTDVQLTLAHGDRQGIEENATISISLRAPGAPVFRDDSVPAEALQVNGVLVSAIRLMVRTYELERRQEEWLANSDRPF